MKRIASACIGAALVLGLLVFASAALAASPGHVPLEGHLRSGLGSSYSTNWSGYAANEATFTSAQGDWEQPAANCESVRRHSFTLSAFWVGLDGDQDNTVEQTGTEADCEGPTPVYYAWWELYPRGTVVIHKEVSPGDQMHAQVTQSKLVLEDITRKWVSEQSYLPGSLAFSSAEWIAEAPAKNAVTNFGSVHFDSASASTQAFGEGAIESPGWGDEAITLVSGNSLRHLTVLAAPQALEEKASAFTIRQGEAPSGPHGHSGH
jgi:hypothetical protein